jgi:uncharacterized protein (DUF2147 family)
MNTNYDTAKRAEDAAKAYAEANGGVDTFDGMNCNDYLEEGQVECCGWDGFDRRCDCGNRRVSWDIEKTSDGKFYAVARAY